MKNNKDTIIHKYFIDKLKPVEIAKELNISKSAVTQVLQKDKRYQKEKIKRIEQNKENHNEKTKKYIKNKREVIKRKKDKDTIDLRNMHNQATAELSKKKRLSNMAYRNWNKSAFTYNKKRNGYEFRKELGRSYDVPKFINVEVYSGKFIQL